MSVWCLRFVKRLTDLCTQHTIGSIFYRLVQALLQDDAIAQATLLADTISKVHATSLPPCSRLCHIFDACGIEPEVEREKS